MARRNGESGAVNSATGGSRGDDCDRGGRHNLDGSRLCGPALRLLSLRLTMHRISLFVLLAALATGQDNPFTKPPAEVDAALRARIKEFYDYHVSGQFRKADEL